MPKLDPRVVATSHFVANAFGAVLVAYIFLVVLMTSAVQQRVIARLDAYNSAPEAPQPQEASTGSSTGGLRPEPKPTPPREKFDYSSGRARLEAAAGAKTQIAKLKAETQKLERDFRAIELELWQGTERMTSAWQPLELLVDEAGRRCPTPVATEGSYGPNYEQRWLQVQKCAATDPDLAAMVRANANNRRSFEAAQNAVTTTKNKGEAVYSERGLKVAELTEQQDILKSAAPLDAIFSETTTLQNAFPFSRWIVDIPPAIQQIVMAFVSGTFGALLVTLVLIVYPNNSISASAGTKNAARIFLGGLISTGVFIVLGGGASILGAGGAFDESKANFMTFCAVGVLAGMFSDRVALWLSARADTFFGDDENGAKGAKKEVKPA